MLTKNLSQDPQGYVVFDIDGKMWAPLRLERVLVRGFFCNLLPIAPQLLPFKGKKQLSIYTREGQPNPLEKNEKYP
jgi:hypothetical protein